MRDKKIKLDKIKKAIDADLNKKLSLAPNYEIQEKLRIQAKKMKGEFEEEFYTAPLKIRI